MQITRRLQVRDLLRPNFLFVWLILFQIHFLFFIFLFTCAIFVCLEDSLTFFIQKQKHFPFFSKHLPSLWRNIFLDIFFMEENSVN